MKNKNSKWLGFFGFFAFFAIPGLLRGEFGWLNTVDNVRTVFEENIIIFKYLK